MLNSNASAPVIVGVGQQTWRETDISRTPVDALHEVANLASRCHPQYA